MQPLAIETKVVSRPQLVIFRGNVELLNQKLGPVFSLLQKPTVVSAKYNLGGGFRGITGLWADCTGWHIMYASLLPRMSYFPEYWDCGESPWAPWPPSHKVKLAQPTHNTLYYNKVPSSWCTGCWWDYQGLSVFHWKRLKESYTLLVFHFHFIRTNKKIALFLWSWCSFYKVCRLRSKTLNLK